MLDFLHKELVDTVHVSNIGNDLSTEKRVLVNGREHILKGFMPCAVACALVWKVPVPSSKQFKYAVHIGIAQQNQLNPNAGIYRGVEVAEENAYINPAAALVIDNIDYLLIEKVCESLIESITSDKMTLTEEEVIDVIKKRFSDSYSQKYPLDMIAFNSIKAYV